MNEIFTVGQFSNSGTIRNVFVPVSELEGKPYHERLRLILKYGQNDIQNSDKHPSVSTGDVINLDGNHWVVSKFGFTKITHEDWHAMTQAYFKAEIEKTSYAEELYNTLGERALQLI